MSHQVVIYHHFPSEQSHHLGGIPGGSSQWLISMVILPIQWGLSQILMLLVGGLEMWINYGLW